MGDRCSVTVTIDKRDVEAFKRLAPQIDGTEWGDPDAPSGLLTIDADEVNYAAFDERETAAAAGLRFYGHHSEGGEYGAREFAATGGAMVECDSVFDGLAVRCDSDTGEPIAEELAAVKRLIAMRRAIREGARDGR